MLRWVRAFVGSRLFRGLVCLPAAAAVWIEMPRLIELLALDPIAYFVLYPVRLGVALALAVIGLWLITVGLGDLMD
jgi:hypothetical protein